MNDNVIPFPPQMRVMPGQDEGQAPEIAPPVLVDHDGRVYQLADLIMSLPSRYLAEVDAAAPRSGQAAWDEVVRRWPALAEEIVAGVNP